MNRYFRNLNRIEFIVTLACTGRCKHCSQGEHSVTSGFIDGATGTEIVRRIAEEYPIESVMTFGGEPLLYADTVYAVHSAARDAGIPARQLITNGFFSKDGERIKETAKKLIESGVNDVALSADSFHQETIPLAPVKRFAEALLQEGIQKVRVHPAWLVSETDDNPYNRKTREIIREFRAMGISASEGNVIFPAGNALKYLGEYFDPSGSYVNPYEEDSRDVRAICIPPDGSLFGKNIYDTDIREILNSYSPE